MPDTLTLFSECLSSYIQDTRHKVWHPQQKVGPRRNWCLSERKRGNLALGSYEFPDLTVGLPDTQNRRLLGYVAIGYMEPRSHYLGITGALTSEL